MKPFVWKEGMSVEDGKNGAYWERNMLALAYAVRVNSLYKSYIDALEVEVDFDLPCGWYTHGEWEGWARVISLDYGTVTFHVPDDFNIGDLQKISANWDGHTSEEKWINLMSICGVN